MVSDFADTMPGLEGTVFVKNDDSQLVRIATSMKNKDNKPAKGTLLDNSSEIYEKLINGMEYVGIANIFDKWYFTKYSPLKFPTIL